ncbi:MAG: acyltransferase domain-containing protein, partial [Flavobacteriales bacterium]
KLKLRVPTENEGWPVQEDQPRFGGVNSFGFGGSNVHLVLQDHKKKVPPKNGEVKGPRICTLSARDQNALDELVQRYIDFLGKSDDELHFEDICRSSAIRRTHHDIRLAAVADNKEELAENLRSYLNGESLTEVARRRMDGEKEDCVFIFSGQGPQWWGMGRELYQKEPLFRSWIEKLDGMLAQHADWSLIEELTKDEEHSRISDTNIAQPGIFAIQIALYEMWKAVGIHPTAVVGHSIGEVPAAYVAGALTLEQAVLLIFHRSRVQFKATDKGRMLAVGLPYQEAKKLVEGQGGRVSVGAVNGPEMVTLSGDTDRIEAIAEELNERDVFHRMLMVNVPFHSHHMEPLRDELLSSLGEDFQPSATEIPFYSTVEGQQVDGRELTPDYWYRNVREPVFLTSAIEAQIRDGHDSFLELGPHPIHASGVKEILEQEKKDGLILPSIRRKEAEKRTFLSSLAALHTWGFKVDWEAFFGKSHGFVDLPRYPWQRESYWIESQAGKETRIGSFPHGHPHLKSKTVSPREPNNILWDIELDKRSYPYIEDHKVQGPIIYPGAGHVDLTIAAARVSFGDKFAFVEKVDFENGLFLPDSGEPPMIRMDISHDGGDYFIYTRPHGQEDAPWTLCSQGRIDHLGARFEHIPVELEDIKQRVDIPVPVKPMQDELHESGLYLGPSFRNIKKLWRSNGSWEALSEIEVHESIRSEFFQFNVHPGVLDSCFQTVFGIFNEREDENKRMGVYVPRHIEGIKWYNDVNSYKLYVHGRLREWTDEHALGELWIFNEDGSLVAEFHGFQSQYLKGTRGEEEESEADWYYEYSWNMKPRAEEERLRDPGEYLQNPLEIQKEVDETLETVRNREEQASYYQNYEPEQYRLTLSYIVRALQNMGMSFEKGNKVKVEELIQEMGVIEEQQRLFHHLFKILTDAGILKGSEGHFEVVEEPEQADVFAWMDGLKENFPQFLHESTLLGRCGPEIQNVLQGEVDPVQLIFPEDDWQAILKYYVEGFAFKKYNDIAERAVSELIRELPENQTLRILEVGAGVGGVTQAILPLLPPERTEYVFTDLSRMFTMKAKEQFGKYPFVRYELLDIEQDPEEQGFDSNAYDLVIASDVIHATSRLSTSLDNVRKLLASQGQLLLLEVTNSPVYLDLIFGMTEGWWMFQDTDIRPHHATMAPEKWKEVLEQNGFHDVNWFSDFPENEASCQSVLLARSEELDLSELQEGKEQEHEKAGWLVFTDEGGVAEKLVQDLEERNKHCIRIRKGDAFEKRSETDIISTPQAQEGADHPIELIGEHQRFEGIIF